MDINLLASKGQRYFECVDTIDRISKLPDEILGKILSYLPTKQAVATTTLSKRREHLSTLTADLDFSDDWLMEYYRDENENENDCVIKMESFQKYVDRVIYYHGGSNIRKCSMSFRSMSFASSFYTWICAVLTCNVEELALYGFVLEGRTYYHLPCRLFSSCNTLVVLRISGKFVIDLPTYVCFPCLKLLAIQCAIFVDDASMERLFSGCPVLEELKIIRHGIDCLEIMNISVPSLKRLCIITSSIQIKINTPCLENLMISHWATELPKRYFVNFTSSLVHATLQGLDIVLLNAVSQVEHLDLTVNDESLQSIIRDSALPIFKNLKKLKLDGGCDSPIDWKLLPNLLDSSPNLQLLILDHMIHYGLENVNINLEDLNYLSRQQPESSSMNLKRIEIFEFGGSQVELKLVEYLLKRAKVLEKMIIHRFDHSKPPRIEKRWDKDMFELLSVGSSYSTSEVMRFKRSSSSCQVIFID